MQKSSGRHTKKKFFLRFDLPVLLAFIFFAGLIFFYLIPGFEKVMMDRKRNMIREMTASAYSLLEYYHNRESAGEMNGEEAKRQAWSAISTIRYGDEAKDYFWITDRHPFMIMHPYRDDLNGRDLSAFRDQKGKLIFVEFAEAVTETGESYVEYMWQWNDDSTRIVPKLSYVRLFKPWNWIIGTGIYIDDVRSEIRRIELRASVISGIIGIMILFMLSAIARQGHKIEQERKKAEEELHRSRELYRTLAEAATEGVLIWSQRGLQANRTLLNWLDYSEHELSALSPGEIINLPEAGEFGDAERFYEEMEPGRTEECRLRTKSGDDIIVHAGFSRILFGDLKSVLIVFRQVKIQAVKAEITAPVRLFEKINTGFFRISIGRRMRFVYASDTLIELLGTSSFNDLSSRNAELFFADQSQFDAVRRSLLESRDVSFREFLLKTKQGHIYSALLNIIVTEVNPSQILCDGTIDLLSPATDDTTVQPSALMPFSTTFLMDLKVSSFMRHPVLLIRKTRASDALSAMKEAGSDAAFITGNDREIAGAISSGLIGSKLSEGKSPETYVSEWMVSPPLVISSTTEAARAFSLIGNAPARALLVKDNENNITGMITDRELTDLFSRTPEIINDKISSAGSAASLANIWNECRKLASSMILSDADPSFVTSFISRNADTICRKVISTCIDKSGPPPCRFAFIQTGSAGRMEQTLSTDQDNAIIFESLGDARDNISREYFVRLGSRVNAVLAETGFRLCRGGNMAGNPQWCQPLETWKDYFSGWIRMPGPDELLEISIFFDFRFCHGDASLSDELKDFVFKGLRTSDIFFHHMAKGWKDFGSALTSVPSGKSDIKKIVMLLTGLARLYSLRHSVSRYSTIERLAALYDSVIIDRKTMNETIMACKDLTSMRIRHQASCIARGEEPDNIVDFSNADTEDKWRTVKAFESVGNLLLKAGTDFYTETI